MGSGAHSLTRIATKSNRTTYLNEHADAVVEQRAGRLRLAGQESSLGTGDETPCNAPRMDRLMPKAPNRSGRGTHMI